jgi:hypothetical protein
MNQTSEMDDNLQPEYDFTQLTIISRGEGRKKSNVQLYPDMSTIESADLTPAQWNKTVANNPLFAFLHDPEEDIYTLEDGIAICLD